MSSWKQILFGILLGFLLSGAILLVAQTPRGAPITLQTRTPRNIVVHVAGAVKNPGVYTLPWSSRVTDAIQAAGGFSDDALLDAVNLASSLSDGEKITIPLALSTPSPVLIATPASKQSPLVNETRSSSGFPININNALAQDLERLPGIGPTKAQAIVLYRQENGSFKKLEDILKVPGIGQVTYDSIKELITINN